MNRLLFFLILFLIFGAISFFVWVKFFCPECRAFEEKFTRRILDPSILRESSVPKVESSSDNFTLKNLNGETTTLADFKGKNVLLVFWATYCGWCAREKEDLMRFTEEKKGRIEVVAIVEEPRQVVWDYVEKEKINFTILIDEKKRIFEKYRVLGTPHHFLIDSKGEIVVNRPGYASYDDLLMLILALND